MKAKFLCAGKSRDGKTTELFYSYKGYEYCIVDYGWYGVGSRNESLSYQHKIEQLKIDEQINAKKQTQKKQTQKQQNQELQESIDDNTDYLLKELGWL